MSSYQELPSFSTPALSSPKLLATSSLQTPQLESSPATTELQPNRGAETASSSLWTLMIVAAILVSIPLVSLALDLGRRGRLWLQSRRYINQVPCKDCRFFKNTLYLNCAVRPLDVLTERAAHCPDYCPRVTQTPREHSGYPDASRNHSSRK